MNRGSASKKKTAMSVWSRRWKVIAAVGVGVVLLAVIVVLVLKRLSTSENMMTSRLEKYSTETYKKELKDRDSSSYTLNLNYLERRGYDMSPFDSKNCDKAGTYAIISVDKDKNITNIKTQLKCD